ncbi:hypothetical protein JOD57_003211 [Geodermatophilus bullaregiensis]|uniref:hypothetical protein n=1 Tax=Geodermatophilus bullaregiensis TaxID=1564160 RepID=UPI00195E5C4B|nr:hypothetical protein [Geodermatophilus bullaregiensis]MBM7807374.1 hypothetical protein [Geodermatophilus bullaregiensis]
MPGQPRAESESGRSRLPVPINRAVVGVLVVIAVLAVLGVVAVGAESGWRHLDLDGEYTVPAAFSALLLGWCALAAAVLGRSTSRRASTWPLALLFALMAVDESFSVHERLESATGVDWQLLYSPVVLAGAVAWVGVAWQVRRRPEVLLPWVAGAVAWGVAQVLEAVQWDGDVKRAGYTAMMVTEELLEMTGSAAWGTALALQLAALGVGRHRWSRAPRPGRVDRSHPVGRDVTAPASTEPV